MNPALIFNTTTTSAVTMNGNITGTALDCSMVRHVCVQAVWSGTPAGNIVIKGSNDGTNYIQISSTAAGGAAGTLLSNLSNIAYAYVRVDYAFTSSTGTLTVVVTGKS